MLQEALFGFLIMLLIIAVLMGLVHFFYESQMDIDAYIEKEWVFAD